MEPLRQLILTLKPASFTTLALILAIVGVGLIAYVVIGQSRMRESARTKLSLKDTPDRVNVGKHHQTDDGEITKTSAAKAKALVPRKILKQASDFYAKTDPDDIVRIRQKLIRAGYLDPAAVGIFFVLRVITSIAFFFSALAAMIMFSPQVPFSNQLLMAGVAGLFGYFMPNLVISRKIAKRIFEYRSGFPDFMDLMIVCADAGMSMEAAIERVSREIAIQYPALSQNLAIITIELRAGRQLSEALKSLSERLGLEEVRSFAVLLQQSKELGTSLSDTLRVFSEEMRHKRMSIAEEKAHALPAKMTIPVTVFILPVIMLIATIPVIVRLSQ